MLKFLNKKHKNIYLMGAMLALSVTSFSANSEIKKQEKKIEIAFVLDTDGINSDALENTKSKVWSIANAVIDSNSNSKIRMSLITYRLWDDEENQPYTILSDDLTDDIQAVHTRLVELDEPTKPKSFNSALDDIVNRLDWTAGDETKRILFHISKNALIEEQDNFAYKQSLSREGNEKIIFNTIQLEGGTNATDFLERLAQLGHGKYIADARQNQPTSTPFDSDIVKLQGLIDKTLVPYGSRVQQADIAEKLEKKKKASPTVSIDNSKFYAKKGINEVLTGGGDLVSDTMNKKQLLDEIPDEQLPKILRGKSLKEKQDFIDSQLSKRQKLEETLLIVIDERDNYIREKQAEKANNSPFKNYLEKEFVEQIK